MKYLFLLYFSVISCSPIDNNDGLIMNDIASLFNSIYYTKDHKNEIILIEKLNSILKDKKGYCIFINDYIDSSNTIQIKYLLALTDTINFNLISRCDFVTDISNDTLYFEEDLKSNFEEILSNYTKYFNRSYLYRTDLCSKTIEIDRLGTVSAPLLGYVFIFEFEKYKGLNNQRWELFFEIFRHIKLLSLKKQEEISSIMFDKKISELTIAEKALVLEFCKFYSVIIFDDTSPILPPLSE